MMIQKIIVIKKNFSLLKNLVNVSNGKNIGNIIDVNIDYQSGNIKSFIIESKGFFFHW